MQQFPTRRVVFVAVVAIIFAAYALALAMTARGQDDPPVFAPTPGLVPEPTATLPIHSARSTDLFLPLISVVRSTTIGDALPPVTPTAPPFEVTPVPTPTVEPTATPTVEPTGTPFIVTPAAPPLVDVPLIEFSNAAVGGVWTHVAVCNHTGATVAATVTVTVTVRSGGAELHQWPDSPAAVESGNCAHLYAILPTSGPAEHMQATVAS